MSTPLKHALVDHHEPAWKVAQRLGISEPRMTKLAQGRATPRDWEKTGLSEILGKPPHEIFPNPHSQVAA